MAEKIQRKYVFTEASGWGLTLRCMKTNIIPQVVFPLLFCTLAAPTMGQVRQSAGTSPHGSQSAQAPSQRFKPAPRMATNANPAPVLGDPLPGLTAAQLLQFTEGLDEFEHVEDAAGGLGPVFNNVSCVACHNSGGTGGASAIVVTRFGRTENGIFDPLAALGGSLLQDNAIDNSILEQVPLAANVTANRQSTPLFGLGLIEAIPDEVILRNAMRPPVDGIRGRAAKIIDVASGKIRVGRFGWKCQQADLLSFAGDAYLNEMGITNRLFPEENAPNGDLAKLAAFDLVADPEDTVDPATGRSDIDAAASFMRFLAPPQPLPLTVSAQQGRQLFTQLNCAVCHLPSMMTARSNVTALSQKPVNLYSDLLLHDMGSLGDGIVQSDAGARELRTTPLWGLRASAPYLHDGRAPSIDAAIRGHDGEAKGSRDRFLKLSIQQQQQVVDFLKSL
jgi:CxxC motif-containing protein (DUF1111 family)